jgi:Ca-activated chloride channel family protein
MGRSVAGAGFLMSMVFEWWWAWLALPLPLLIRRLVSPVKAADDAVLRVPWLEAFDEASGAAGDKRRQPLLWFLAVLMWLGLVAATARPQLVGEPISMPVSGRDLMLAVDLSGSMEARDFELRGQMVDRLTATKAVASEFISRRAGDRLGLILFGRQAYLQVPLTFDRETVKVLLFESEIGLAGKETAIGDAIGLAVKRMRERDDGGDRVLVLLTDGANTAGEIAPDRAAKLAASEGLRIHTIGIGADEMIVRSLLGTRRVNPSAELDEATLTQIAESTGGQYFRARDVAELERIYAVIDQLEPVASEEAGFRPRQAVFFWPLSIAFISAVLVILIGWREGAVVHA